MSCALAVAIKPAHIICIAEALTPVPYPISQLPFPFDFIPSVSSFLKFGLEYSIYHKCMRKTMYLFYFFGLFNSAWYFPVPNRWHDSIVPCSCIVFHSVIHSCIFIIYSSVFRYLVVFRAYLVTVTKEWIIVLTRPKLELFNEWINRVLWWQLYCFPFWISDSEMGAKQFDENVLFWKLG